MWRTSAVAVFALAVGAAGAVCVARNYRPSGAAPGPPWTRLASGLAFRVQRVAGATDVAVLTEFDIGSDHDPPGKAGLAHLTEHLYVTAAAGDTPRRNVDAWNAHYDGKCFATTRHSCTSIGGIIAPGALAEELADVAARMSVLRIDPADVERERPRVLEQVAESESWGGPRAAAPRLAVARVRSTANDGRGVGIADELNRLTIDELREQSRRYYKPVNARLVVAGAIDPPAVTALVTRLFESIPAGERAPEPVYGDPKPGLVRVEPEDPPGPGYKPGRAVSIAYPYERSGVEDDAAALALGEWKQPGQRTSRGFWFVPEEHSIAATWTGDERPVEDVVREFEALVEDFVARAPTGRESGEIRAAYRQMQSLGIVPSKTSRSMDVAFKLIHPDDRPGDMDSLLAAVDRLRNDDIRRFVARWHIAERRVVVDLRGWEKSYAPGPADAAPSVKPCEVRVAVTWDESTQTSHRKIGGVDYPDDAALEKAIRAARDDWVKKGKPDAPVTIDADAHIPWSEVIQIVNVIKRCGIDKIEFAFGAPPKRPAGK